RLTSLHSNNYSINDTSTTALYTLSLHDALPISITLCHPPSVLIAISKVQRSPCHLSARARAFCRVPHCHSEKQSRSSSLQNSSLSSRAAKAATRSFTSGPANSSFIAALPRARPSPSREVLL